MDILEALREISLISNVSRKELQKIVINKNYSEGDHLLKLWKIDYNFEHLTGKFKPCQEREAIMDSQVKQHKEQSESSASARSALSVKKRVSGLIRSLGFPMLFDVVIPLVGYYGLRAVGVSAFYALIIGALPIVCFQLYQIIKNRKIDFLALLVLAIVGFSVAIAFITGSARFMLAKTGFFTGAIGAAFLVSLLLKKPLAYTIAASLLHRMKVSKTRLNRLWTHRPEFRRVWRISTAIWGAGILLNAVIIGLMAYTLPLDVVPVLNAIVHLIIFIALQIITNIYYRKKDIWKLVFTRDGVL